MIEVERKGNHYILNAVPMTDPDGVVSQILVVETNVTAQKMAEEEMQKTLQKERQLNELKSRFVSMASHEFRTPLATILSSSNLVEKHVDRSSESRELKEKVGKHFSRIRSNVNNLTSILNDFLSLDKLEAGAVQMQVKSFRISELVREIADEFTPMMRNGQSIRFDSEGSEDTVALDRQMLRNIMNNLLSNAIKYSADNSTIHLRSKVDNNMLTIEVEDHGIGIPQEEQKQLFERFFRARNATNIQGTGLGLNIVKRYVDFMQGNITFESELDKGTVFKITLPQFLRNEEKNPAD